MLDTYNDKYIESEGNIYYKLNGCKEPLPGYKKLLKIEDNAENLSKKAHILYLLNQDRAALDFCSLALKLEPENYRAWWVRGQIFFKSSDYNSAIEAFLKAIEIAPNTLHTLSRIADSYFLSCKYNDALFYYQKILEMYSLSESNYFRICAFIAECFWGVRESYEALNIYRFCINQNPNNELLKERYLEILKEHYYYLFKSEEYSEAVTIASEIARLKPACFDNIELAKQALDAIHLNATRTQVEPPKITE